MSKKQDDFNRVDLLLKDNKKFLEGVLNIHIEVLHPDARDYLFSQLRKTVGVLGNIMVHYGSK